ncbi:MAG: 3-dehydroquinate synthase [Clostridia bacterium]|nr:3-dehydroquinate synthase [Clostridia bacterium]
MGELRIQLGDRSYRIIVLENALDQVGVSLKELGLSKKCILVTNSKVGGLYSQGVLKSLSSQGFHVKKITLEDGEEAKSLHTLEMLYREFLDFGIDRGSAILALGGGVVGDVTGFAASTYMRGLPFIQLPTTLLAQVDSSVGGKVAINHSSVKNLVGAFYQPKIVIIDPTALRTLPLREFRAGMAEVIKYGLIWDEAFFTYLEGNVSEILEMDLDKIKKLIHRSCEIKAQIVSRDELEENVRMILNLGHTFGHAFEILGGLKEFNHGEAVGAGTCLAAAVAKKLGHLSPGEEKRIINLFEAFDLPLKPPGNATPKDIVKIMSKDKKNRGRKITLILPQGIGEVKKIQLDPSTLSTLLQEILA